MAKDTHPGSEKHAPLAFVEAYQRLEEMPLSFDLDERAHELLNALKPFLKESPKPGTPAWCFAFLLERQLKATRDFIAYNASINHLPLLDQKDLVLKKKEMGEFYDRKDERINKNSFFENRFFLKMLEEKQVTIHACLQTDLMIDQTYPGDLANKIALIGKELKKCKAPTRFADAFYQEWLEHQYKVLLKQEAKLVVFKDHFSASDVPVLNAEDMRAIEDFLAAAEARLRTRGVTLLSANDMAALLAEDEGGKPVRFSGGRAVPGRVLRIEASEQRGDSKRLRPQV